MAGTGGKRKGAGGKLGSIRPHIAHYWDAEDIKDYFMWLKKEYKKRPELAKWVGDQLCGKAVQPIGNDNGEPLKISFDSSFVEDK